MVKRFIIIVSCACLFAAAIINAEHERSTEQSKAAYSTRADTSGDGSDATRIKVKDGNISVQSETMDDSQANRVTITTVPSPTSAQRVDPKKLHYTVTTNADANKTIKFAPPATNPVPPPAKLNPMTTIMDSLLEYYEDSDTLARLAEIQKKYYDELVKAGFTEDQALKIVANTDFLK